MREAAVLLTVCRTAMASATTSGSKVGEPDSTVCPSSPSRASDGIDGGRDGGIGRGARERRFGRQQDALSDRSFGYRSR